MILIGVVFTGDPRMQQVFRGNYGKAVRRGGGVPVFLPWKPKHAAFWARHLDGFLFTGGGDPDPRYYGQSMRPECGMPTPAASATATSSAPSSAYAYAESCSWLFHMRA